uniref:Uncharacterized protein n=1 Tax=Arundo donax TaxID=35708 RepID=A0A0A8Z5B9_ARUDO
MDPWSHPQVPIPIVQPTMEMTNKQTELLNALIATPLPASNPLINDIYTTITHRHVPQHTPINITAFPPDFIL